MNNSKIQVKAQVINTNLFKSKILFAGSALIIALLALAIYSKTALAETESTKISVIPYQVKSQKLSH